MIDAHEPHCPVPRMAAKGEGAICLCRKGNTQVSNELLAAKYNAEALSVYAKIESMKAANARRADLGQGQAYGEEAFMAAHEELLALASYAESSYRHAIGA